MNRRMLFLTFAVMSSVMMTQASIATAAVGGKNYNITGQNVIDGSTVNDVFYFNANNTFNTDSNPGLNGQWTELNLLLFSIYLANIDFTQPGSPLPLAASTLGLSAGTNISGITVARVGPLITLTGAYSGTQIP